MERPLLMELSSIFLWVKDKSNLPLKRSKMQERKEIGACSRMYISCKLG